MGQFIYTILLIGVCLAVSCTSVSKSNESAKNQPAEKPGAATVNANAEKESAKVAAAANKSDEISDAIKVTKNDCLNVDTGDNEIVKNQTFPIDFAPFKNSCFVTSNNPEFDDPPMESEFAIYKNGEKVFDFPGRFNGVTFGCRVESVVFEDLNNDNLKDIAVVGKCQEKSAPYNENMIYVNTGKAFITKEDANYKLAEFKKIKEITDFAKSNQIIFFN